MVDLVDSALTVEELMEENDELRTEIENNEAHISEVENERDQARELVEALTIENDKLKKRGKKK